MLILATLINFNYFGVKVHLTGDKATVWPASTATVDGKILNAPSMARFAVPQQVQRHGAAVKVLLKDNRVDQATLRATPSRSAATTVSWRRPLADTSSVGISKGVRIRATEVD
jgi:hypothetical protein